MNIKYFLKLGEQTTELNFYIEERIKNKTKKTWFFESITNYLKNLIDLNEGLLIGQEKNDFTLKPYYKSYCYKSYLFNFFLKSKKSSPDIQYKQNITNFYFSTGIIEDDLKNSIQERLGSIFFIVFMDKNLSCIDFPDNIGKYMTLEVCDPKVYPQSISFNSGLDFNNPVLRFFIEDFSYRKRSHDFVSLLMQEDIESIACSWREDFTQWLSRLPLNCEQHNQAKEKLNQLSKRLFYNAKVISEVLGVMKNNRGYFHNHEQYGPIYFYWKINGIIIYLTDQGFSISKFSLLNKESYQEIESILIRSLAELYLYADNCFLEGQLHIQDLSKAPNENQLILLKNLIEKIRKNYSLKYWLGISEQGSFSKQLSNLFSDDNKNTRACILEQEMRNATSYPPSKETCSIWRNTVYQRCAKYIKGQESVEWKFFDQSKKIDNEITTLSAAIKLDIGKILIIEGSIGTINALCFFVLEKLVTQKKAYFSKFSVIAVKCGSSILITSLTGLLRNFYLNRFSIPFFLNDTSSQNQLINCATSIGINSVIIMSSDIMGMGIERVGIKYNLKLFIKLLFAAVALFLDKEFYNNTFEWSVGFCMNFLMGLCVTGFLSVLWKRCKKEGEIQSRTYVDSLNRIELSSLNDTNTPLLNHDFSQEKHKSAKIKSNSKSEVESIWSKIIKSLDKIRSQRGYADLINLNGNIDIYINAVDLLLNTRDRRGKSNETQELRDLDIRYKLILIFIKKIESFIPSSIKKTDYQQISSDLRAIKERLEISDPSALGPLGIKNLRNDFYESIFQLCGSTINFQKIEAFFSSLINEIGLILFYEDLWGKFESEEKAINSANISEITGHFNLLDQAIQRVNALVIKISDEILRTEMYNSLAILRINIASAQKKAIERAGFIHGLTFFKREKNSTNNLIKNNRISNQF